MALILGADQQVHTTNHEDVEGMERRL